MAVRCRIRPAVAPASPTMVPTPTTACSWIVWSLNELTFDFSDSLDRVALVRGFEVSGNCGATSEVTPELDTGDCADSGRD